MLCRRRVIFGTLCDVKRSRFPKPSRRQVRGALGVVALGAAGIGVWMWLKPRTIGVCVVSDYSFRQQRPNWRALLEARFAAANGAFSGTGVQWAFRDADQPDPTGKIAGIEERRQKLIRTECDADVILGVTGLAEGSSGGDVP